MNSDNLKQMILLRLQTFLKPQEFRKKGTLFTAQQGDCFLFVQLQSSSKSTRCLLVATVNLGIFSQTVASLMRNTHAPNILEAHWRIRIGHFIKTGSDKWWDIQNEFDANIFASDVINILASRALPQMRSLASAESLQELWKSGQSPGLTEYEQRSYLAALDD